MHSVSCCVLKTLSFSIFNFQSVILNFDFQTFCPRIQLFSFIFPYISISSFNYRSVILLEYYSIFIYILLFDFNISQYISIYNSIAISFPFYSVLSISVQPFCFHKQEIKFKWNINVNLNLS